MIDQSFSYENSSIKEMTNFFGMRVENLEPMVDKRKSSASSKKKEDKMSSKRGKEMTLTQVS